VQIAAATGVARNSIRSASIASRGGNNRPNQSLYAFVSFSRADVCDTAVRVLDGQELPGIGKVVACFVVPCKVTKKDGMKAAEEGEGQVENKRPTSRRAPRRTSEMSVRGGRRGSERGPGWMRAAPAATASVGPGGLRGSSSGPPRMGQRGVAVGVQPFTSSTHHNSLPIST
jgi:hypothetical protein